MNKIIVLFGFSGSGKSTIANQIGSNYNLRVIHPSGILRDLYEGKTVDLENTRYNTGFWESNDGIRLFKSRLDKDIPLDVLSDRILLNEVAKGNVVIDTWSLPWLTNTGLKIYLKADLSVRAQRVSKRSNISYESALDIVNMKDDETRCLFQRIYGFDIRNDDVFDLVLDTNKISQEQVFRVVCGFVEEYFIN
ncbi:MAG: cytidylate kinase family protein [Nanoarchaeota archaeon]|nr:cytidylate kinase family protein [Nanoarchaeota archaeon]MBU1030182.1 cytidylate kinase family protein [Nanoarchaeota archaeon]MBU1849570.1 cytidylate kinase family protein [Nanoarchaeota archaeon]